MILGLETWPLRTNAHSSGPLSSHTRTSHSSSSVTNLGNNRLHSRNNNKGLINNKLDTESIIFDSKDKSNEDTIKIIDNKNTGITKHGSSSSTEPQLSTSVSTKKLKSNDIINIDNDTINNNKDSSLLSKEANSSKNNHHQSQKIIKNKSKLSPDTETESSSLQHPPSIEEEHNTINTPELSSSLPNPSQSSFSLSTLASHTNEREGKLAYLWENSLFTISQPKHNKIDHHHNNDSNNDKDNDDDDNSSTTSSSSSSSTNSSAEEDEKELFTASGRRKRTTTRKDTIPLTIEKRSRKNPKEKEDNIIVDKTKMKHNDDISISKSSHSDTVKKTISLEFPSTELLPSLTPIYMTKDFRKLLTLIEQNAYEHIISLQEPGWVAVHDVLPPYSLRRVICNSSALRLFRWTQAEIDARVRLQRPVRWLHPDYIIDRSVAEVQARKDGNEEFTISGNYLRRKLAIERTYERYDEKQKESKTDNKGNNRNTNFPVLPTLPTLSSVPWRNLRNFNVNNGNSNNNGMDPVLSYAINGPLAHALAASNNGNDDEVIFVLEDIDDGAAYVPFTATEVVTIQYVTDPLKMQQKYLSSSSTVISSNNYQITENEKNEFAKIDPSLKITHLVTTVFKNVDPMVMNIVSPLSEASKANKNTSTTISVTNKLPPSAPTLSSPPLITNILSDTSLSASMVIDSITSTSTLTTNVDPRTTSTTTENMSAGVTVIDNQTAKSTEVKKLYTVDPSLIITQDMIEAAEERECVYDDSSDEDGEEASKAASEAAEVNATAIAAAALAAQLKGTSRTESNGSSKNSSQTGKPSFLSTYVHRPFVVPRMGGDENTSKGNGLTKPKQNENISSERAVFINQPLDLPNQNDQNNYTKENVSYYNNYYGESTSLPQQYSTDKSSYSGNVPLNNVYSGYSSAYMMNNMHNNMMNSVTGNSISIHDPMYGTMNLPISMYNQYMASNMFNYPPVIPIMDTGNINNHNNYGYRGSPLEVMTNGNTGSNMVSGETMNNNLVPSNATVVPPNISSTSSSSGYPYSSNSNYYPSTSYYFNQNMISAPKNTTMSMNNTEYAMNTGNGNTTTGPTHHHITAGGYTLTTLPPLAGNNSNNFSVTSGFYNGNVGNMNYGYSNRSLTENMMSYMNNNTTNTTTNSNIPNSNSYTKFMSMPYNNSSMVNHSQGIAFIPPSTAPINNRLSSSSSNSGGSDMEAIDVLSNLAAAHNKK